MLEKIELLSGSDMSMNKYRIFKLAGCERFEALVLLELGVWKRKIDEIKAIQASVASDERYTRKRAKIDRQDSRFNCGADVVVGNVLPYLGKVEVEE